MTDATINSITSQLKTEEEQLTSLGSLAHLNPQSVKVDTAKRKAHEIQIRLNQLMADLESTVPNAGYVQHVCHDIGSLQRELAEHLWLLDD